MAWLDDLKNSSIKNAYVTASADLSISYTESITILQAAKSGGITATELDDLRSIYTNAASQYVDSYVKIITKNILYTNTANAHWWGGVTNYAGVKNLGNLATGFSETNYQYLIDKWGYGTDLPMPIVGGDAAAGNVAEASYSYALASGALFESGVAATDVNQGYAGTCYLLASLGAIANVKPDVITGMFTDNGNNSYGVKFYDTGSNEAYTTVNKQLPVTSGNKIVLAGNSDKSLSGELWVSLAEKAYAQYNAQLSSALDANSYQAVEGGLASPLKQVANLNYNYYSAFYSGFDDPYRLNEYVSTNSNTYKQTIIDGLNAGAVGWLASWGDTYGTNGKQNFVEGHAFMLLGYNSATDKFIIRNPWGGDGSSYYNPQFEASISDFWNSSVKGLVAISTGSSSPTYSYTISSNTSSSSPVTEGSPVSFTLTRSGSGTTSVVYVSTATGTAGNADYAALNKQAVAFAANETSKTVDVSTYTDSLTEGTENFSLQVYKNSTDSSATTSATGYIKDAATTSYSYTLSASSSASSPVTEGGAVTFTIKRSGSGSASTVYVSTAAGTAGSADFEALSKQAVTFAANETIKTLTVNTYTDSQTEGTENFSLQLYKNQTDSTVAASTTAYIKDATAQNYSYTVTSSASNSNSPAAEGSDISFTITRSGTGSASTIYVSTLPGTAGVADYVAITKQAISFEAYETIKTVSVNTTIDWWLENTEYFSLAVYKNQSDAADAYHSSATAYLTDSSVDPYNYEVTSNASSSNPVTEGGAVTFTITRSGTGAADAKSTVYLSTATGTAGNADYATLSKQELTFAANETSKTVSVNTYTDALTEDNEYFNLNVYRKITDSTYTAYGSAYIKDATSTGYSYTVTTTAGSGSPVTEGGTVNFTITRSGSGAVSTVYVSTANGTAGNADYTALNKQAVTFAANETIKAVSVNTNTDSLSEGSEYFYLNLYKNYADSVTAYANYGTAYIKDATTTNYSYTVTSNAGSSSSAVSEGGTVTFTVTRSGSGSASTVYVDTADGTAGSADYAALSKQALTFAANETSKTVSVNTYTDALTENPEYFWLKLYKNYSDSSYSTYGSAYIKDATTTSNYTYSVTTSASSSDPASEGNAISFTITRNSSGSASTVYVSTEGGTATEASDYAALDKQAVTFAAYETSKTVTVNTYTDALTEGSEYFYLNLYKNSADSFYNYSTYATGYIKDAGTTSDYSYTVASNASTSSSAVAEGNAVSFTITRSSSGTVSTVYVSTEGGSASEATDYASLDKQAVTFAANETSKTVTVNTYTDALTESPEYFWLNLYKNYADSLYSYSSYGAAYIKDAGTATNYSYTITSNASTSSSAVAEGTAVTFTITRSSSGTASTVYLSTEGGTATETSDYAALDKQAVTFAANETSKTLTINTYTDALTEGNEYFYLDLYKNYADSATAYASYGTAYIKDAGTTTNYSYTLTSNAESSSDAVTEGGAVTFTITRSSSGSASTIYLSTEDGSASEASDYAALDKQAVTFAANETSKTVTINTYTDSLTESPEYFWLNLYQNYADSTYSYSDYAIAYIKDSGSTSDYSYTVTSNASSSSAIAEGGAVTFTITRNGSGSAATVYVSTEGGTASETTDYASLDKQAVMFAAYETSKTVTVNTYTDALTESPEYFWLNLYKNYADSFYDYDTYGSAYIKDAGTTTNYSYTVTSNASGTGSAVAEGNAVTFTIKRSASGTVSTVYVSTEGGTATETSDYASLDKQAVTFAANETSKTVTVNTYTDSLTESNEYFYLDLYKNYADSATAYASYGTAYIKDAGTTTNYSYTLTSNASSSNDAVTEGNTVTFTVTRSSSGTTSTVYVSTEGGSASEANDYATLDKYPIVFAANETSKTFTVTTYADLQTEDSEYFYLDLYKNYADSVYNYATYATAYIKDAATTVNYTYTVASSANSSSNAVTEGSPVTFTITRSSSGTASTVYVNTWAGSATDGVDYATLDKQEISFATYETSKTVSVNTYTDSLTEGDEYFWLTLYNSYAHSLFDYSANDVAYIKDAGTTTNYTYTLSSNASNTGSAVAEGGAVTFTITRNSSGTASTVYVSTEGGSATEASDYAALDKQAVTFAANETSKTITVNTYTDAQTEGSEYFYLDLYKNYSDSTYSYATYATAYIKDTAASNYNYTVTSSASSSSNAVTEGSSVTFTITRSSSGSASTVYVSTEGGSASETSDYAALDKQAVTFAANETSKTVTVTTYTDALTEGSEYFYLDLYKNYADSVYSYATYATAYIKDATTSADYTYTVASDARDASSAVAEGGAITFTITRSGTGAASTVYVNTWAGSATDATDYASLNKQAVAFAAYETSKTVSVNTYTDSLTEGAENFWLTLYKNYADSLYDYSAYDIAYIKDAGASSDYNYTITSSASSSAVAEGNAISFTITRSSSGTASTVYVNTWAGSTTDNSDYAALDKQTVSFAANETSKTVTVNTYTDSLTEGQEYFWLTLYKNYADSLYSYSAYAIAYIKDATATTNYTYTMTSSASASSSAVTEGGSVTFTITRSGSGAASTVYVSSEGGSATEASDYAALDKQAVTFAANETSKTVTVSTYTDALTEGSEYFYLNLYKNYADSSYSYATYATAYIKDAGTTTDYSYSLTSSASSNAATEGSTVTFTITRTGSGTASTVYVSTEDGSAGSADYVALNKQAVTFAANETSKTVSVTTKTDSLTEGKEYFWLNLYKNYADGFYDYTTYSWGYIDDPSSGAAHATSVGRSSTPYSSDFVMTGTTQDDHLVGGPADDYIIGGQGNDLLTGGIGADSFVFNAPLNAQDNLDTITDFQSGTDQLLFSHAIFSTLAETLGPLNASEFYAAPGAVGGHTADNRLVYDSNSGKLYYDTDGSGAETAVQVALIGINTHPELVYSDIQIINS